MVPPEQQTGAQIPYRTNAPTMRVFIFYEGFCEPFDVPPDQTVGTLKKKVKNDFLVQLSDDEQVRQCLELSYGGAALQDSWSLRDIGITSGKTIRCLIKTGALMWNKMLPCERQLGVKWVYGCLRSLVCPHYLVFGTGTHYQLITGKPCVKVDSHEKSERRPVFCVFNTVTGEILEITGNESLLHTSVAKLKTLISVQSGIPVSAFRLSTPAGVQLYDCNCLQDYSIEIGTILRLDTWDGWVQFLQGCLRGHRLTVQSHLLEERPVMRFQLRVALYIAACAGHLDLAGWLLERGVHAEEPVGVHPYRQWCRQTAHQDTGKCPIHVAAESSQLLILKLFITKNLLSLASRDPAGRDPLKIAIQHGHRDCAHYLANKLCSVVSLPNMSLPMRVYLQIKHWVLLGKKRAASNQGQYTRAAFKDMLGNTLLIDGFSQPKMSSKSRTPQPKSRRGIMAKALQPLPPISNSLSISSLPSTRSTLHLPSLQSVKAGGIDKMQKKHTQYTKSGDDGLLDKMKEGHSTLCKDRFIRPPSNRENIPTLVHVGASSKSFHVPNASLESSHRYGQTPKENAVHCWTIASAFTEKPWLKQLSIARTLIRKQFHSID